VTDELGGGASRSTDPAAGSSAATDVSLREFLTALIVAAEQRSEQQFSHIKEVAATASMNSQLAISKVDAANEKRFEGVNEFRAALSDQASRLATRDALVSLSEKLEAAITRQREDIDALSKKVDLREGRTEGARVTIGAVVTIVSIGIALLSVIVLLANYAAQ
jgi:hypothetical protein